MSYINKIGWRFDNTYSKLPGNMLTKLAPTPVKAPELLILNHSLSKDAEYAKFMSTDWSADLDNPVDGWRVSMAILTYLVDIFDVYDKVEAGLVDKSHLDTRMRTLKFGVMKTPVAKGTWASWKNNRDQKFIDWFESEIYGEEGFIYDEAKSASRRELLNTHRD